MNPSDGIVRPRPKKTAISSVWVPRLDNTLEKHGNFHVFRGGPRFFGSLCPGSNPGGVVLETPQAKGFAAFFFFSVSRERRLPNNSPTYSSWARLFRGDRTRLALASPGKDLRVGRCDRCGCDPRFTTCLLVSPYCIAKLHPIPQTNGPLTRS